MQRVILGPTVSGGGTVSAERYGGHQPSGLVREVLEGHSHLSVGRCPRQQFRCSWENVHLSSVLEGLLITAPCFWCRQRVAIWRAKRWRCCSPRPCHLALLTLLPIKGHGIENGNAQIQGVQEAPLSISFTHSVVTLLCFQTRRSSLVSLIYSSC